MFFRCLRGRFSRIFALVFFVLAVLEATEFEGRPQKMREIRATVGDLAWQGRTYLGRVVGEQTYLSVEKVAVIYLKEKLCLSLYIFIYLYIY